MKNNVASRPVLWDVSYPGMIPPTEVIAVSMPDNLLTLEGHDVRQIDVGHSDTDDTSIVSVSDLELVAAGDVIYNGAHMYLGEGAVVGGFDPWRAAIDKVDALGPKHIVAGHQDSRLDDDAERTIAWTREYLDDADTLLASVKTPEHFFTAKVEKYPEYPGRTVLWSGARALYGVREHPNDDPRKYLVAGWK